MGADVAVLEAAVDAVCAEPLTELSLGQLQDRFARVSPLSQRLTGFGGAVLAELDVRGGGSLPTDDGGSRSVAGWAAEVSGDSASAAGRMIRIGTALQQGLPRVAQAVLDGTVPLARAEVLTRLVGRIDPGALAEAEPSLILAAQRMDPVGLAAFVRHQIATWVEPVVEDEEAKAAARRYLKTRRQADGSLWGSFLLAGGDAESLLTTLEPLARPAGVQDARSAAQRRADALVEVCEQVLRHGDLPEAGGFRPQLSYVLPADWAARQADAQHCGDCRRCPQHQPISFADLVAAGVPATAPPAPSTVPDVPAPSTVPDVPAEHGCAVAAWTGPQTRARIETVLCDARITRVLLSSLGQVTGMEQTTHNVTKAQRRALAARDLGCAVRGCTRPPAMCDAHHLTHREHGGETSLGNLVLLCRRHHVLWHLGRITLRDLHVPWLRRPDGHRPPGTAPPRPLSDDERIERFLRTAGR